MHSRNERFFTDFDIYLWKQGSFFRAWEKMGAHPCRMNGRDGVHFAVWAPNAERVCVVGDFNDWREGAHELEALEDTGIWHGFVPEIGPGALYKYAITSRHGGYKVQKADPYGFFCEIRPQTASIVWDLSGHQWNDSQWMRDRGRANSREAPISIYEVHLGSWMRVAEEGNRWLTYRELAPRLAEYVTEMGFTHVELLPVTEHPFDGSWGYQTVGYFAPTSRFGTPQDFMAFVDILHQNGIGVILDWVPAHFPTDEHGLGFFDGTHLYEHADPRLGFHNDWKSFIFNFGRNEVINFLISSALFWLDVYHVDGLRVDAVASMLYLDYSRQDGEWIPNKYGGNENLEAIAFLKRFNEVVYREFPDVLTIAEESTAWPMVSRPTYLGGLGFGFKWNMGWMHDTLLYFSKDPIHRKYHHNHLTFSILYAFTENFVLPFSHDEVVHGKGSMPAKMPGDLWQKFANLRLLYGYMFTHPGKKLLFMGNEFGQWSEWNHDAALDWHLLQYESHRGLQAWVRDLNAVIRREAALYELDHDPRGFEWIDCNDSEQSTLVYMRRSKREEDVVVCAFNFTPVPRQPYRLGVPFGGYWKEVLNSDADLYGGSGLGNLGGVEAEPVPFHGRPYSLSITLPPLAAVLFQPAEPPGK